jgi:hypothetical protein
MTSDWIREHKERNATNGGAPMALCLCCLQGEKKRCRFVNVTGRFPMSLSGFVRTIRQFRPREVRRWRGVCVAFRAKERGVASLMLLGGFQCLRTGCVSTIRQFRPREVRRWRGVCVAFRAKKRGVVSLMLLGDFQCFCLGS